MLRSMYAGVSGMRGFQTKLDVIGNNIANVGTVGFKKGRTTFQDMMSQTVSGAQAPTANRGGVNPSQVGLGSQLGSIDNIHTQGFRQTTNIPLDFALEGNGMFVVESDDFTYYTRAGNFYLDELDNIVNPDGYHLIGYESVERQGTRITTDNFEIELDLDQEDVRSLRLNGERIDIDSLEGLSFEETEVSFTVDGQNFVVTLDENDPRVTVDNEENQTARRSTFLYDVIVDGQQEGPLAIPENAESFSIQTNGIINYVDENGDTRVAGQIVLANFSNPAGLEKAGSNLFLDSANSGYTGLVTPETEGAASIVSGSLEMSNVDLAEEFTEMITAQRGFQANTRIITTSDEILQELVNLKR